MCVCFYQAEGINVFHIFPGKHNIMLGLPISTYRMFLWRNKKNICTDSPFVPFFQELSNSCTNTTTNNNDDNNNNNIIMIIMIMIIIKIIMIITATYFNHTNCMLCSYRSIIELNSLYFSFQVHTCHISHCEIKSRRIWPIWKAIPIKISNLTEFSDHFTTEFMKK